MATLTLASGGMLHIAGVEMRQQPVQQQSVASGDAFRHRQLGLNGGEVNDFFVPILPPRL